MSKLSRIGYGLSVSPHAYTDQETGKLTALPPAAVVALHEFRPAADGHLEHSIDGVLRAIVPPEGLAEYAKAWPDAAELVRAITGPGKSADPDTAFKVTGPAAIAGDGVKLAATLKPGKGRARR
jgi:hypothetical protein